MDDLISRSALKKEVEGAFNRHYEKSCYQFIHDFFNATIKRIKNAPAVDAVPVVRCKDCVERTATGRCNCITGRNIYVQVNDDFFCSYGERRADDVAD